MKASLIYKIQSIIHPERCYIGSAVDFDKRKREHLWLLTKGIHHSIKLQNHFNKYGESDLIFSIIEPCLPEFLTVREDSYFHPLPYFNICPKAGSCLGKHHSEETIKKMRGNKNKLGKIPSKESCDKMRKSHTGLHASNDTKQAMSKSSKGKHKSIQHKQHIKESWVIRKLKAA